MNKGQEKGKRKRYNYTPLMTMYRKEEVEEGSVRGKRGREGKKRRGKKREKIKEKQGGDERKVAENNGWRRRGGGGREKEIAWVIRRTGRAR